MALPHKKISRSKKRMRSAHRALKKIQLTLCSKCQHLKIPHRVCRFCGYYKGREVINMSQVNRRKKVE